VPVPLDFIDAFPSAASDIAELLLGEVKFDRRTRERMRSGVLGEAQHGFGNPRLQVPKQHVLDLLAGLAQPLTQYSQQDQANVGALLEKGRKISAV